MGLHGETVTVYTRIRGGEDEHGDPVDAWAPTTVPNVLVAPLPGSDVGDALRPDGVRVEYRLAFPKAYTRTLAPGALRGCRVALSDRGMGESDALAVSGSPDRAVPCPTAWDTIVEVGRTDG